jgi:hypothetical protein
MSAGTPCRRATGKPKILTVAEIEQAYPDEWVLIEITRDAKDYRRRRGRLLVHSRDRADLKEAYQRFRAENPHKRTFWLFTGEIVPEGVVVIL